MKYIVFLCVSAFIPLYANTRDVNVCSTFADVVSMNEDRLDQAEIAFSDASEICKDADRPKSCVGEIEKEYNHAKQVLEKSVVAYNNAGCGD